MLGRRCLAQTRDGTPADATFAAGRGRTTSFVEAAIPFTRALPTGALRHPGKPRSDAIAALKQDLARFRERGEAAGAASSHVPVPPPFSARASVLSDDLYRAARPIWDAQLRHPFVRGLRDGSLDVERFMRWVRQDYLYLKEFARIFAWAAAKADRLASMAWYANVLDLTLNTEMALHRGYAERFGISAEQLEREPLWPTTRAYTDFLIRTSADGDVADLLAALLPCAWGYVDIARHLAGAPPPKDERYAEWIAQYASAEFAEAAEWLKTELNRVSEPVSEEKRRRLIDLFVLSSRYEWRFWEMCWHGETWQP